MVIRTFNIFISIFALLIFSIPLLLVWFLIKITSKGPAIHWSKRIGKHNEIFLMPKFRTMLINTPQVATHLLSNSTNYLTPIGGFLRKSSLDELPQLWSVLIGDMNLVGPRPALFNQDDLRDLRTKLGIDKIAPGVTGWAQINGRDELPIPVKVQFDKEYLERRSLVFDLKIIFLTIYKVLARKNITH
jgi:O-antigen biosynthesis protein WbqP